MQAEDIRKLTIPILAILIIELASGVWLALTATNDVVIGFLLLTTVIIILLAWWGRRELTICVKRCIHSSSLVDLKGHIMTLEAELEMRRAQCGTSSDDFVVEIYTKKLKDAKDSYLNGDESTGWRCFVEARLAGLNLLADKPGMQDEINTLATVTLWKSKKRLSSWQLDDIKGLLQDSVTSSTVKSAVTLADLVRANTILEEQLDDNYESLRRAAWQLYVMIATACAALVFLALTVPRLSLSESPSFEDDLPLTAVILVVGILGGATGGFGCILSMFARKDGVLYEQALNSWLVAVRPLVGAVLSFVGALFLFSGLLTFGDLTLELLLSVCFVAGFSEELVLAVVKRIAGGPSSKE